MSLAENLSKISKLFKSKGVELSADELASLAPDVHEPTPAAIIEPVKNIDSNSYSDLQHNRLAIEALQKENLDLKSQIKEISGTYNTKIDSLIATIEAEKKVRDEANAVYKAELDAKARAESEAKIEALIQRGVAEGRVAPKDETAKNNLKKIAETGGLELAEQTLSSIPSISKDVITQSAVGVNPTRDDRPRTSIASGVSPKILEYVNTNLQTDITNA